MGAEPIFRLPTPLSGRNQYLDVPPQLARTLPSQIQELIGYSMVSRHDIAGIWVAFFSRCQRYYLLSLIHI